MSISLPIELIDKLTAAAGDSRRSRSAVIEDAILAGLPEMAEAA